MKLPWQNKANLEEELASSQSGYVTNPLEVTRSDESLVMRNANKVKRKIWMIYGIMAMAVLAFMSSCATSMQMNSVREKVDGAELSAGASNSPGRFAATQAIAQWLAASPSPLPGGQIQSWTGATKLDDQETTSEDEKPVHREIDNFTLVDGYGHGYTASVEVAYTDDGQSSAISTPSLTPLVISDNSQFAGNQIWPGTTAAEASTSVKTAVEQWAKAFTSGDANALRQQVNDPSTQHIYVPISGVSSVTTNVSQAAESGEDVIAQVSVAVQWSGRSYTDSNASNTAMTYDVLISGADTASPHVVAWGAPGSGPKLKAFQNAITLDKAQVKDDTGQNSSQSSSQAPSPTSSASPTTGEGTAPKPASTDTASATPSAKPSPTSTKK